jgi:Bacterial archaeo-eukaryotic release factor family 7
MSILRRDELKALMQKQADSCVSIYLPTHRAMPETQQDPIRFKNLLAEAEKRLLAAGLRSPDAKQLLEPAQKLLDDPIFWRYQSDGLAVFLAPDFFRFYTLPINLEELVVTTNRFHLKPLLEMFACAGSFYILALSQNALRLFQATQHSINELFPLGIPDSLDDALNDHDPQRQLQFHTGGSTDSANQGAVFHGHGGGTDESKDRILRYCRGIDTGLHPLLKEERAPLVLASVDYLLPLYKEANTYSHLMNEVISGNPESLSAEQLHEQAWKIVQPHFQKAQVEALAKYHQLAGTGQTSTIISEVIQAATGGRVASLFVAVGVQQWAAVGAGNGNIESHDAARPGDADLLDLAATQTLMNGGEVFVVQPEMVPGEAPLAAVFRY